MLHALSFCSFVLCLPLAGCHLIAEYGNADGREDASADTTPLDSNAHETSSHEASIADAMTDAPEGGPIDGTQDSPTPTLDAQEPFSPNVTFSPAALVPGGVNTTRDQDGPWLSSDGRRLYYSDSVAGSGTTRRIYFANRLSLESDFSDGGPIAELYEATVAAGDVTLSADETVIIYERVVSTTEVNLYQATRTAITEPFSPPQPLPGVTTTEIEEDPSLSADGKVLVFNRHTTTSPNRLYYATRASLTETFSPAVALNVASGTEEAEDPCYLQGLGLVLFESNDFHQTTDKDILAVSWKPGALVGAPQLLKISLASEGEGDAFVQPALRMIVFVRGDNLYQATY
ncbi:MAG: PD40 domain-containing protein [Deltaproteobacteria bacterium]|nr:PD40 domain-containing protein [Deltaproteobacteria bacterium]